MPDSSREGRATLRKLHHDMRTPLGQILGYAEILEEDADDAQQTQLLPDIGNIKQAARDLLQLIDVVFQSEGGVTERREGEDTESVEGSGREVGEAHSAASGVLSGARVLVVDDEEANRELLRRRLEPWGVSVHCVADGRSALHAIEAEEFDLVLLDLIMPEMDGLEVLQALRRIHDTAALPVIMVTAVGGRKDVVAALRAGANDYVTKPVDLPVVLARMEGHIALRRANDRALSLARELTVRNAFIRRVFGRYVSDEIVTALLEDPDGLELRGEKREVTILICDLRGFSALTEALDPLELVWLLNRYLGAMADTIHAHHGTIDEFIGDAVLAFFGAPLSAVDDAQRAVDCALAMQDAMLDVNEALRARGLPEIAMGIGIATGEVIVGSVGSDRRSKYTAVGSTVNLAARIESFTLGGEVWMSEETLQALGPDAPVTAMREVQPKGFAKPLRIHQVVASDRTTTTEPTWHEVDPPHPVVLSGLDGKRVLAETIAGHLVALGSDRVLLESDIEIGVLDELFVRLPADSSEGTGFAKVTRLVRSDGGRRIEATFYAPSADLVAMLARLRSSLGG